MTATVIRIGPRGGKIVKESGAKVEYLHQADLFGNAATHKPAKPEPEPKGGVRVVNAENVSSKEAVTGSASRFKPHGHVEFSRPLVGPSGAKLKGYVWQYTMEERPNREGEMKPRRVSNWDAAVASAETDRGIVHQFDVEYPDGRKATVSAEGAVRALGYGTEAPARFKSLSSAAKTLAKLQMQRGAAVVEEEDYAKKIPGHQQAKEEADRVLRSNKQYRGDWDYSHILKKEEMPPVGFDKQKRMKYTIDDVSHEVTADYRNPTANLDHEHAQRLLEKWRQSEIAKRSDYIEYRHQELKEAVSQLDRRIRKAQLKVDELSTEAP